MALGYITIVTPIDPAKTGALETLLRTEVAPASTQASLLECRPLLRFDQIMGLHFCSFVIIREADGSDPRLVFEATFDGPREEFFHDLLRVAVKGVHAIYQNCVGYPRTGTILPELVKDYLRINDAGSKTFFSGSPGRSVMQVRGEQSIRDQSVDYLSHRSMTAGNPTTFLELQRDLQHEIIRARPENHWAEQAGVVPWEVSQRFFVVAAAVIAAGFAAFLLGMILLGLFGLGVFGTYEMVGNLVRSAIRYGQNIPVLGMLRAAWLILLPMIVLAITWLGLRFLQFMLQQENPRDRHFWIRSAAYIVAILQYAIPIFAVGFTILAFDTGLTGQPVPAPLSWLMTWVLLIGIFVAFVVLSHWTTTLKLMVQFRELTTGVENWRRLWLDAFRFFKIVLIMWALTLLALHIPPAITGAIGQYVFIITRLVLVFAIYAIVGIIAVYAIIFAVFNLIRFCEKRDLKRFKPAKDLIRKPSNPAAFEREEGGVNRYQNHLASVTYVKPGCFRLFLLRLTLFAVQLLARFWFNRGDLGGIPTIFAARWTLIDNGRRLLFFSNYGGAWDSYLNEFIDMGAVTGLNGIWSNTFLEKSDGRYAFPETEFYLWRGAENERPFKSYVRHSQIETLVWYGAYPTLSIINVNNNTALRQALFKPLKPYELDAVFLKAGL